MHGTTYHTSVLSMVNHQVSSIQTLSELNIINEILHVRSWQAGKTQHESFQNVR
jgi:hypothetical protein